MLGFKVSIRVRIIGLGLGFEPSSLIVHEIVLSLT